MGEGLAEIPGRDARHSHCRHGLNFVKAQFKKFRVSDGIDVRVVGAGAVPRHQKRRAFMQIMYHRGVPVVEHAVYSLGGLVSLLMSVAVDVNESTLRPIGG